MGLIGPSAPSFAPRPSPSPIHTLALLVTAHVGALPAALGQLPGAPDPFEILVDRRASIELGSTLFTDQSDPSRPRIVEVDLDGQVVWEYVLEPALLSFTQPGFSAEKLPGGNILFVAPRSGVYEITPGAPPGVYAWSIATDRVSHDADRLTNGNTLFAWGGPDQVSDNQVTEVNAAGQVVWSWSAGNHLAELETRINFDAIAAISIDGLTGVLWTDYFREGFTHTNAVQRTPGGLTMISLRNFALTVFVDPAGTIVHSIDWTLFGGDPALGNDPHEPEVTTAGTVLVALQRGALYDVVEVELVVGTPLDLQQVIWGYSYSDPILWMRAIRDADRLPGGNTLIQSVVAGPDASDDESTILEISPLGEIVWQLVVTGAAEEMRPGVLFTAQRILATQSSCGDCNGDGTTSVLDSLLVAQFAAGAAPLLVAEPAACNIQGTPGQPGDPGATVDILDALAIAQVAAGLPCP